MRRTILLAAVAAVSVPAFALAAGGSARQSAQAQCRAERAAVGSAIFKLTYGTNRNRSNAFGKCVSRHAKTNGKLESSARQSASHQCTAERAAGQAAFAQKYGTNKKGTNAFGKCVSQKAKALAHAQEQSQQQAEINAAKQCKAERAADPAAFAQKYGTNHNKRNAFGKCVSKLAKQQHPYVIPGP
ncbi:MAG: hypothetical protein JWN32_2147 [Solirubrobacterales bacterium]|nr:hypothetical protein [Solirubrobacterales bacterium]